MATMKTDAQKVTELRKQAMDKSLPQEVRDMADKKANEIEGKSVEKATGMKLAKGGAVKAAVKAANSPLLPPYLRSKGSIPSVTQVAKTTATPTNIKQVNPAMMAKGGAVAKELPKRGSRTATNMAKGGSVAKKAKK